MPEIIESDKISGVYIVKLKAFGDARGRFMETFRKEWFPQRSWDRVQTNRSDSAAGVVRGLHYHYKQVDYWVCMRGMIRAGLADLRPDSPTFKCTQTIDMGDDNMIGLFIPVGVAHGFATLTDATLTYIVDNYYDSTDEFGVAWDDADLAVAWGVTDAIVSERDAANPRFEEIPQRQLLLLTKASMG